MVQSPGKKAAWPGSPCRNFLEPSPEAVSGTRDTGFPELELLMDGQGSGFFFSLTKKKYKTKTKQTNQKSPIKTRGRCRLHVLVSRVFWKGGGFPFAPFRSPRRLRSSEICSFQLDRCQGSCYLAGRQLFAVLRLKTRCLMLPTIRVRVKVRPPKTNHRF